MSIAGFLRTAEASPPKKKPAKQVALSTPKPGPLEETRRSSRIMTNTTSHKVVYSGHPLDGYHQPRARLDHNSWSVIETVG
jgi:hypothetical protein